MKINEQFRSTRLRVGMTQEELAAKAGMTQGTIARFEAGTHSPTIETLSRIAGALNVQFQTILGKYGEYTPESVRLQPAVKGFVHVGDAMEWKTCKKGHPYKGDACKQKTCI